VSWKRWSLDELESAAAAVYEAMTPTPQQRWPLLDRRCGTPVSVKHENQTAIGTFKIRGALLYFHELAREGRDVTGVVAATRGNFGQAAAFAAQRRGIPVAVVVPHGNSRTKNQAMVALGAELMERGDDFQASYEAAAGIAAERGWLLMPSFAEALVRGVASYSLELFRAVPDLDTVYVPIGLGSGICGAIAARDALRLDTRIVGVVSAAAPAYALSFAAGRVVPHDVATRVADGLACRLPVAEALDAIRAGAERILQVTDEEIEEAMRALYSDAKSVVEGAGAAGLAALMQEQDRMRGRAVAIILTGANVDPELFARVLVGGN
jgi:threonine dehydratase